MGAMASQIGSLFNGLFMRRSKKIWKLRVTGFCVPGTGEFPAQMTRNAENASIWWRHHAEMQSLPCHVTPHKDSTEDEIAADGIKSIHSDRSWTAATDRH